MRLLREASLLFGAVDAVLTAPFEPAQHPLVPSDPQTVVGDTAHRKLHGRFLQITDLHPDPFYKVYSSPNGDAACHSKSGAAGYYGAEATDCDSPLTLINETFKWIDENLKDSIDFVIWTGDSARHDNDERNPRSRDQVIESNELMVEKFVQVFGKESGRTKDFIIPVVPTYGNNDILPHNVFTKGPNKWTKAYSKIWKKFIPEEQRHGFERGGWFSVEVIPNQLVVFSLNTLYFFDSNAAVDGCSKKSEPGYEHMEWLRIQLQFLRERGMKAIIMGHVPPARTQSKQNWDETCWQKYTLWTHRYRDVIVGSMYGHMNVDHFMLQDSEDIDLLTLREDAEDHRKDISSFGDEFTIQSAQDYLLDLRKRWSKLPGPPETQESSWPQKESKYADKIGGQW
ncbi:MAG: p24 complex component, partial [Chaenotheca gracillima]